MWFNCVGLLFITRCVSDLLQLIVDKLEYRNTMKPVMPPNVKNFYIIHFNVC